MAGLIRSARAITSAIAMKDNLKIRKSKNTLQIQTLDTEVSNLPPLPSVIRYYDDFTDEWHSLKSPETTSVWRLQIGGSVCQINFDIWSKIEGLILKHWAVNVLTATSAVSVSVYMRGLKKALLIDNSLQSRLLAASPLELKEIWHSDLKPVLSYKSLSSIKSLLAFYCEFSLGQLSPGFVDFVGAFRLPRADRYAAVRNGDVFLAAQEEAAIVEHLDEISGLPREALTVLPNDKVRSACILCIAYQYAMRRTQIAKLCLKDVRIYPGEDDETPAIHLIFLRTKQRSTGKRLPMVRKIKHEWGRIFLEWHRRRTTRDSMPIEKGALPTSLFGLTPDSLGRCIGQTTEEITGIRRPPNHLRHSAAQRLVDAGASQSELAEFMGHSSIKTGLVYFAASAAQAERVNKALALSPIYRNVAEVAQTRTIDTEKLLALASDNQIGGVPHGVPIAGIGACDLGQSLCSKNPVLSCYSCRRFIAVTDIDVHRGVLQSLRPVVRRFYDESRDESNSPAYMQLRRSLESVQSVVSQLEEQSDDEH